MAYTVRDLFIAIGRKKIIDVQTILNDNPEMVDSVDRGTPALMYSLINGGVTVTTELILRGANVNIVDRHGQSPILYSLGTGTSKIPDLLIQHGANLNDTRNGDFSVIMGIVNKAGRIKLLKKVFNSGQKIDIDYQDKEGRTALMYACNSKDSETIGELIKQGADVSVKDNTGKDAYSYGDKKILQGFTAILKMGKFKDLLDL